MAHTGEHFTTRYDHVTLDQLHLCPQDGAGQDRRAAVSNNPMKRIREILFFFILVFRVRILQPELRSRRRGLKKLDLGDFGSLRNS